MHHIYNHTAPTYLCDLIGFSSTLTRTLRSNYCPSVLDTVGWVNWPIKIVPDMTNNVFSGTINFTLLLLRSITNGDAAVQRTCMRMGVVGPKVWNNLPNTLTSMLCPLIVMWLPGVMESSIGWIMVCNLEGTDYNWHCLAKRAISSAKSRSVNDFVCLWTCLPCCGEQYAQDAVHTLQEEVRSTAQPYLTPLNTGNQSTRTHDTRFCSVYNQSGLGLKFIDHVTNSVRTEF